MASCVGRSFVVFEQACGVRRAPSCLSRWFRVLLILDRPIAPHMAAALAAARRRKYSAEQNAQAKRAPWTKRDGPPAFAVPKLTPWSTLDDDDDEPPRAPVNSRSASFKDQPPQRPVDLAAAARGSFQATPVLSQSASFKQQHGREPASAPRAAATSFVVALLLLRELQLAH